AGELVAVIADLGAELAAIAAHELLARTREANARDPGDRARRVLLEACARGDLSGCRAACRRAHRADTAREGAAPEEGGPEARHARQDGEYPSELETHCFQDIASWSPIVLRIYATPRDRGVVPCWRGYARRAALSRKDG